MMNPLRIHSNQISYWVVLSCDTVKRCIRWFWLKGPFDGRNPSAVIPSNESYTITFMWYCSLYMLHKVILTLRLWAKP